jgi:endonuclease-8
VATRLRPALEGQELVRFEASRWRGEVPAAGELIESVEARGKHLLVHFAGGLSLRTHLRMTGSWHLYRVGERWGRPRSQLRVLVEAANGWQAVCFNAPEVETYRRNEAGDVPEAVAALGPDLCDAAPDLDAVLARLATLPPEAEVGDALLNQRVASGIGNVYKSEAAWAVGLDPFTLVAELGPDARRRLYATAHRLLRANLGGGSRVTHEGGVAVYGRAGRPCPRCGTLVKVRRQGPHARSTYWCPGCQGRSSRSGGSSGNSREGAEPQR